MTDFALMLLAVIVSILIAGAIVKVTEDRLRSMPIEKPVVLPPLPPIGVVATLRAAEEQLVEDWTELDIALGEGESVSESLAASQWEGEFVVTFAPGKVRNAQVGALIRGGSLIVMKGDEVLLSDFVPADEERVLLTRLAQWLPRRHEQFTFIFKPESSAVIRLQAMWQPQGEAEPRPLPISK